MKSRTAALVVALLPAACNPGGPSTADLSRVYRSTVEIISCAKVSESAYRCRFKFTNPRTPADFGEHTQCFTTDGSTWEVKIFC